MAQAKVDAGGCCTCEIPCNSPMCRFRENDLSCVWYKVIFTSLLLYSLAVKICKFCQCTNHYNPKYKDILNVYTWLSREINVLEDEGKLTGVQKENFEVLLGGMKELCMQGIRTDIDFCQCTDFCGLSHLCTKNLKGGYMVPVEEARE